MSRFVAGLAGLTLLAGLLAGCGVSASDLPLPSPGVQGPSYQVTALFSDALNLPDGAHVKLNGDDIGRVQSITLDNYTARVTMALRSDVPLPAGTEADLRQATPLGEIFVAVHPPAHPVPGSTLRGGDVIGLPQTRTGASIEDLLSSFSMLINGGGLTQTQTIAHELNNALDGRTGQSVHLIAQSTELLKTLNDNTANIDVALAATRDFSATLNQRQPTVNNALDHLTPAISLFADQTDNFTAALTSAARTGDTAGQLIDRGGHDIRGVVRDLGPISQGFKQLRPILGPGLNNLTSFGNYLYQITDGDAAAAGGRADLFGLLAIPRPGDKLPGPADFVGGEQATAQDLEHLFSTFGGAR